MLRFLIFCKAISLSRVNSMIYIDFVPLEKEIVSFHFRFCSSKIPNISIHIAFCKLSASQIISIL